MVGTLVLRVNSIAVVLLATSPVWGLARSALPHDLAIEVQAFLQDRDTFERRMKNVLKECAHNPVNWRVQREALQELQSFGPQACVDVLDSLLFIDYDRAFGPMSCYPRYSVSAGSIEMPSTAAMKALALMGPPVLTSLVRKGRAAPGVEWYAYAQTIAIMPCRTFVSRALVGEFALREAKVKARAWFLPRFLTFSPLAREGTRDHPLRSRRRALVKQFVAILMKDGVDQQTAQQKKEAMVILAELRAPESVPPLLDLLIEEFLASKQQRAPRVGSRTSTPAMSALAKIGPWAVEGVVDAYMQTSNLGRQKACLRTLEMMRCRALVKYYVAGQYLLEKDQPNRAKLKSACRRLIGRAPKLSDTERQDLDETLVRIVPPLEERGALGRRIKLRR